MRERLETRQRRVGARVISAPRAKLTPWWVWAALAIGLLGAVPAWAQTTVVPERQAPTLPPGAGGDQGLSSPRSETPLAPLDGARPVPDGGVVTPPPVGGATPIIRPPSVGTMQVIPPPGSPGGDKTVVPK
jgi:hypothetical protein